jgi:putative chitinase
MTTLRDAIAAAVRACGGTDIAAQRYAPHLTDAARRFDVVTVLRVSHWIAQLGHESGGFARLEENLNYSASRLTAVFPTRFATLGTAERYAGRPEDLANLVYEGVNGNGPVSSGDGWRFRGRGFIQLTGRANYARAAQRLALPLVEEPDRAALPSVAALVAGDFWARLDLNRQADRGAAGSEDIRRAVNGRRMVGLADCRDRFDRATAALSLFPERLEP